MNNNYLKFVFVFGIIFLILQCSDLYLTEKALLNSNVKELNPLYKYYWFIPIKFMISLLIIFIMSITSKQNQHITKNVMISLILFYIFVNLNNLYFSLL